MKDGGSIHLDDEGNEHFYEKGDMDIGNNDYVRCFEAESIAVDPKERSFLPNWSLLPSNDSFFLSTNVPKSLPHEWPEINTTTHLSHPLEQQEQLPSAHQQVPVAQSTYIDPKRNHFCQIGT